MKKRNGLILLLVLVLLCGCRTARVPGTTAQPRQAFTGDFDSYAPVYTQEREREWEEDILFFAEKYLTGHAYLSEANFYIQYQPDLSGELEYDYGNSAFDPQKRQDFIASVDALLAGLPERSDGQILCELMRMVAALGDVHSDVFWNSEKLLPLFYEPFYHENGVDYRVSAVDSRKEELLMARLVSYNGIPVDEVVERVSAYLPHESDRALGFQLTGPYAYTCLNERDILVAAGIAAEDDAYVTAEFETAEGLVQRRVAFRTEEQIQLTGGITGHPMITEENLRYSNTESYWWTMLDEETAYMQLTTMVDDPGYSIDNLFSEVRTAMRDAEDPLKVILDFRANGGGYVHEATLQGFVNAAQWYEHDGIYILIDGNCFSAGVLAPYYLHNAIEGSVLVGAPTGQGLWFPANSAWYELPNSGVGFTVGDEITCADRDWTGDALEPDVTVYQTPEDFEAGIDTVIAWVLAD